MDIFDAFIVNMHRLLGHDRTADFIGMPRGDKSACRLCLGHDPNEIFDHSAKYDEPADVIPIKGEP